MIRVIKLAEKLFNHNLRPGKITLKQLQMKGNDMPIHDVMFVASAKQAKRFLADIRRLGLNHPGGSYEYISSDGARVTGTYIGYDGLNLKFRKADGIAFAVPVVDMGDGSLVTEYLTKINQ
jgi:hypothetical protein